MNKSNHTSPFSVEWSNAIQRPNPFCLSSQSIHYAQLLKRLSYLAVFNLAINSLMLLICGSHFSNSEGLVQSSRHRLLGVHSANCCLCLFLASLSHLSHFGKILVHIIIFLISKWAYIINSFLLNQNSVINSIHGFLTPNFKCDSLWPLLKGGEVSSHFHMSATVPSPDMSSPLYHVASMSYQANYSVFRRKNKKFKIFFHFSGFDFSP